MKKTASKPRVFIIAPSVTGTKGGIATVVSSILNSVSCKSKFQLEHLVTHYEGSILLRMKYFLGSFVRLVFARRVSLVHIHVACYGSFYRKAILTLVSKAKGIPIIIHVHGSDFDAFFQTASSFTRFLIKKTFNASDRVVVLSPHWLDFFAENITSRGKIEVLHNGVDVDHFGSMVNFADSNHFLFLGRLGQRKGVYDLLEAIKILVHKFQLVNLQFFLAGDGDLEQVREIIRQNDLERQVVVTGWLDDVAKQHYLQQSATVVLPSYSEGLPMSLIESMAAGKVIISTRVGGIPDLVVEGENGFLIEPGDIGALTDSINRLQGDQSRISSISTNNIAKVSRDYNLTLINERLSQIYADVILN